MNPQDSVSLKRILNVPERGVGKTSIDHVAEYAVEHGVSMHEVLLQLSGDIVKLTSKAKSGLLSFSEVMHQVRIALPSLSPADCIDQLVKKIQYRYYLVKEE